MYKIILLGNMNNNNFSMLRYFRSLGADCRLYLYKDECLGASSHFHPSQDTFHYHHYRQYIRRLPISHHPVSLLPGFLRIPIDICLFLLHKLRNLPYPYHFKNSDFSCLEALFTPNTIVIGSGLAPAIAFLNGYELPCFYPYSTGVEYLFSNPELKRHSRNPILFLVYFYVSLLQAKGIKSTKLVLNAETGVTETALKSLGVRSHHLPIPMYFKEDSPSSPTVHQLDAVLRTIDSAKLSILHFSRLHWVRPTGIPSQIWQQESKNNHFFFEAFSDFVKSIAGCKVSLVVLSYGKDIDHLRRFLVDRNIESYVTLLPIQPRKNIGLLLQKCSLSVGEFSTVDQTIFGGTTWEALANGSPIIQSCTFKPDVFHDSFGFPLPPLLAASSAKEIYDILCRLYKRPDILSAHRVDSLQWFNTFNGLPLARSWLQVLAQQLHINQSELISHSK